MSNDSRQLAGLGSSVTNLSEHSLYGWGNRTIPDDCLVIPFNVMHLLPGNNPDGAVSADERQTVHKIKNCLLLLMFLVAGPTNLINMAVFYKQGLKDRVTLCLFFLAFSDELYVTVAMTYQAEYLYLQFVSENDLGSLYTFIVNKRLLFLIGTFYVSPILSAIISVERCVCVFNPLKFQSLLSTRAMSFIILGVYLVVYSLSLVAFMRFRVGCIYDPIYGTETTGPVEDEFYTKNKDLIKVTEGIVFGVVILGGSMVVVAISTLLTITKLRRISQWRSESSSSFTSRDIALTKMLVGGSILFIICDSPYALFNIAHQFFPEVDFGKEEHNLYASCSMIGEILALIKPCFNIFIYYAMGSRYREIFWAVFGARKPQRPPR